MREKERQREGDREGDIDSEGCRDIYIESDRERARDTDRHRQTYR